MSSFSLVRTHVLSHSGISCLPRHHIFILYLSFEVCGFQFLALCGEKEKRAHKLYGRFSTYFKHTFMHNEHINISSDEKMSYQTLVFVYRFFFWQTKRFRSATKFKSLFNHAMLEKTHSKRHKHANNTHGRNLHSAMTLSFDAVASSMRKMNYLYRKANREEHFP